MADYVSKIVSIRQPADVVYGFLSDFTKFAALIPQEHLKDVQATTDSCTFTAQGATISLAIVDREPGKLVKYGSGGQSPFPFFLWVQLKEVAPYDVRMRLTLRAEMNFMMRGLLGGKLKKGINEFAEKMAMAFNGQMPPV